MFGLTSVFLQLTELLISKNRLVKSVIFCFIDIYFVAHHNNRILTIYSSENDKSENLIVSIYQYTCSCLNQYIDTEVFINDGSTYTEVVS